MQEPIEELLQHMGNALGISLHLDESDSCMIIIDEKLRVQIELHADGDKVVFAVFVAHVDPGKFREIVLAKAMQANNLPYPQYGIFGYSPYNNQLVLFDLLALDDLNGEKMADFFTLLTEKAKLWEESLERGETPVLSTDKKLKPPTPFDI